MSEQRRDGHMLLAPGASASEGLSFPGVERMRPTPNPFPRLNDHIVVPEASGEEVIRNRKVIALPANKEHADAQALLGATLAFQLHPEYILSVELLTRVLVGSNFATDVCIRKKGVDPTTGDRFLEELAFEVVNEQTPRDITEKAEDMTLRGVRRVFAIFVKTGEICEWSKRRGEFVALDTKNSTVVDPVFVRPVPMKALLDHAMAEIEAARALIAKKNPEIMKLEQQRFDEGRDEGRDKGRDEGRDEGQRSMLIMLLETRFGEVPASVRERIGAASREQIADWAKKVLSASSLMVALD